MWSKGLDSVVEGCRYCPKMEEMKALVEPFPLVPDICIAFNRSRSDGCQSSQPSCFCTTPLAVIVEAHTSYPILRHHSIISGIAFLFMPLPDCLMACTMAKLVCKVLRAATASCDMDEFGIFSRGGAVGDLLHMCDLPSLRAQWRGALFGRGICGARREEGAVRGMILFCASAYAGCCFHFP